MGSPPVHNYERLPKWAQDEIRVLRQNAEHWKEQALVAAGQSGGAPITVWVGGTIGEERGLPDETVCFYPYPAKRSVHVQVRLDGRGINVNATRPIVVRPQSSNAVQIDVREDF